MASTTMTVNVVGMDGLKRELLQQLGQVVVEAVRAIAVAETDGRVVARLNEVGAEIARRLGDAAGREAVATAPAVRHPNGQEP